MSGMLLVIDNFSSDSAQMVAQVDPAYASFSPAEQVVALIRQNAALEVRVASYSDADMLQQRLEECQQVCDSTCAA